MTTIKKKTPSFNQNAVLRGAIRRAFARSPIIREILNESRREVPRYKKDGSLHKVPSVQRQCQVCNEWVGASHIAVDHIIPVISTEGTFVDWNTYVKAVWCGRENLQRICDTCHQIKTNKERFERDFNAEQKVANFLEVGFPDGPTAIKFLKKFNNKKLDRYPIDFQDKILMLKKRFGIKFKRKLPV